MLPARSEPEKFSDEEIIARIRTGDTGLYEIVMRRHNQRLFRVALAIVRNQTEAEDVVQEAYVRAYLNLHQFAGRAAFSTWLTKIAVHEALARAKRENKLEPIEASADKPAVKTLKSAGPDPESHALGCQARMFLEAAVRKLDQNYRIVYTMREIEEMTTAETAELLEISEETVKTRLHRAREMIRAELYVMAGAASADAFHFAGEACDRIVDGVFRTISSLR